MSNFQYCSIVEYSDRESGHNCGYCNSKNTSFCNWLWAVTLRVDDYQDLIDRGWRRSGINCYKPIMDITCCPMYTIKCAAKEFRVSKSQKKILKRFHNFLAYGIENKNVKPSLLSRTEFMNTMHIPEHSSGDKSDKMKCDIVNKAISGGEFVAREKIDVKKNERVNVASDEVPVSNPTHTKGGKSRQMKAKYLRIERKKRKLRERGFSEKEIEEKFLAKKRKNTFKTLEEYLNEPQPENPAHKLEIKLVRSKSVENEDETFKLFKRYQMHVHNDPPERFSRQRFCRFLVNSPLEIRLVLVQSPEFKKTYMDSASLFKKYQKAIHKDDDDDCNLAAFHSFLVDSPLKPEDCYGSYHQQYWLDGKLIAVGVVDILPKCLSSVYFLYDPDYLWLSLGTYGALREIEFVRSLASQYPDIEYYYMGFYIHSCVKMKYKAAFKPSYLLCPEVYTWHPIQLCLPKLDKSKYSRLNDDSTAKDGNTSLPTREMFVLYNECLTPLSVYLNMIGHCDEEVKYLEKYVSLVGNVCARRMILNRS